MRLETLPLLKANTYMKTQTRTGNTQIVQSFNQAYRQDNTYETRQHRTNIRNMDTQNI